MSTKKTATRRKPQRKAAEGVLAAQEIERCFAGRENAMRDEERKLKAYQQAQDTTAKWNADLKEAHGKSEEASRKRR